MQTIIETAEKKPETVDIDHEEIKSTKKPDVQDVDIDLKKEKQDDKIKQPINFLDKNFTSDMFKNKKNIETEEGSEEGKSSESTQEQEKKPAATTNQEQLEGMDDIAEFLIDGLDVGISQLCGAIAKEKNTLQFELPREKRMRLSRQLEKIIQKYNFKVSLELLFLVSIALAFKTPILNAVKVRKKKSAEDEAKAKVEVLRRMEEIRNKNGEEITPTISEEKPIMHVSTEETTDHDNQNTNKNRGRRGPARKV